jgi:hypothetical protein
MVPSELALTFSWSKAETRLRIVVSERRLLR